jgi:2-keto-4-pentenoate hydratase/2-oxohepta-3-ene-1,7-dioic acid hydratase in catechol pathway
LSTVRSACEGGQHGHPNNPHAVPVRLLPAPRKHCSNIYRSKPNTALGGPWPAPTLLPKITQNDGSGDYESELAVVIGKAAKNVSEENAMDYVLGFTAANDVSSRVSQLNQSQWCFSKGFDGACPIGNVS